jgi:hypothetical protein
MTAGLPNQTPIEPRYQAAPCRPSVTTPPRSFAGASHVFVSNVERLIRANPSKGGDAKPPSGFSAYDIGAAKRGEVDKIPQLRPFVACA